MEVNPIDLSEKGTEPNGGDNLAGGQKEALEEENFSGNERHEPEQEAEEASEGNHVENESGAGNEPELALEDVEVQRDDSEPAPSVEDDDEQYEPEESKEQTPDISADVGIADSNETADNVDNEEEEDDDDDDEYDPESAYKDISVASDSGTTVPEDVPVGNTSNQQDDEDEYDPEAPLNESQIQDEPHDNEPKPKPSNIIKGKLPAGLPPKPPVNAAERPAASLKNSQQHLKEAYDAIMQSEIVKDPNFVNLPQQEQMKLIMEQLSKRNVNLSGIPIPSSKDVNYDQVYSYNKPFKNLKTPIPLVPINEFCRRPNITAPMTPEEERAYDDFIKREAYYMNLQNWDEFPDKLRLFIGNLPANTISKQDLFRIFSQYGDVIQIAIKAGYGFTQFRTAEACLECIKGESNVPLHNKVMRLDASRPQKSRRPVKPEVNNPNLASRGRDRSPDNSNGKRGRDDEAHHGFGENKKQKNFVPDCQVYITGKSSVFFIRKVKKAFATSQITIDVEDITHRDLNDVISEAAYSGILGACVIKEAKVDVQTFENTHDGGVKFDEYADIDPDAAADILSRAKINKYGSTAAAAPQPYAYGNQNQNKIYDAAMNNEFYETGYSNRRNNDRNDHHNHRGRSGRNDRRGKGNKNNNPWESHHGNNSNMYGQPQVPNYGSPQTNVNQVPLSSAPLVNQANQVNQANLIQTLQGMDPVSMQNMISLLQQQQQQQQQQQPLSHTQNNHSVNLGQSPYGYNQPLNYGLAPPPPQNHSQAPSGQVNTLLSQLQSSLSTGHNPQQSQSSNSSQSLMETLARLSRK